MEKKNIISIFLTVLVIGLLILSAPIRAIDVNLTTPDIITNDLEKTFIVEIKIHKGEFLPILYTDLTFNDELTCRIEDNETNCDFLEVEDTTVTDLDYRQDFGYGYGYGYGYQEFGYGYGYGYGERGETGIGSGTITYTLTIDVLKLPDSLIGKEINVEALVYGGAEEDKAYFKGKSKFNVDENIAQIIYLVDNITQPKIINYGDVVLDIPSDSLPLNTTSITVKRVANPEQPSAPFKILGRTYDFDVDTPLKSFSKPIKVTLTYTDKEFGSTESTSEDKIYPAYYENGWVQINEGIIRDTENNKITFEVDHFTLFTLIADTSIPEQPTEEQETNGGGGSSSHHYEHQDEIIPAKPEEKEDKLTTCEKMGWKKGDTWCNDRYKATAICEEGKSYEAVYCEYGCEEGECLKEQITKEGMTKLQKGFLALLVTVVILGIIYWITKKKEEYKDEES